MPPRLGGGNEGVLEESFRRPTGDGAKIVDQVRLVVIAGRAGDPGPLRPRPRRLGQRPGSREAEQLRGPLRGQSDLLAEPSDDPLAAPAELARYRAHRPCPGRLDEARRGPGDLG